jgi:hypothetical protein
MLPVQLACAYDVGCGPATILLVTHAWTGEIRIFRGSDYAEIGSVKLFEDVDFIGYDPNTKHIYVINGGGSGHPESALASGFKEVGSPKATILELFSGSLCLTCHTSEGWRQSVCKQERYDGVPKAPGFSKQWILVWNSPEGPASRV